MPTPCSFRSGPKRWTYCFKGTPARQTAPVGSQRRCKGKPPWGSQMATRRRNNQYKERKKWNEWNIYIAFSFFLQVTGREDKAKPRWWLLKCVANLGLCFGVCGVFWIWGGGLHYLPLFTLQIKSCSSLIAQNWCLQLKQCEGRVGKWASKNKARASARKQRRLAAP